MKSKDLLIFDMDGVLVDVSDSYRETIHQTVEHFTGAPVSPELIQEFKNRGGFNDDWALSFRLIRDAGFEPGYNTIVNYFQSIFHGTNGDGLIRRERWMAADGLFERLCMGAELSVFTGRLRWEANITLDRFAPGVFAPVIGSDDVAATKPHPDGLIKIREAVPHGRAFYMGDTVDDARAAKGAGVPFIGILGQRTPNRVESERILRNEGAIAVLENINALEPLLQTL